ncbi:hypothetical protein CEXT_371251 [Caerostris extrusa]|uniref:Uncharacterized protein n=1 Tax=Caerostris extrusa TaxID=172846 RepID=A0AAV4T3N0_CAEEX|nr:hypothetical protein CEXT_371251 [Caerostris extrusa]
MLTTISISDVPPDSYDTTRKGKERRGGGGGRKKKRCSFQKSKIGNSFLQRNMDMTMLLANIARSSGTNIFVAGDAIYPIM